MKNSFKLKKIKNDLSFCKDYWTVLYGSFIGYGFIPGRSDIDVAIITQLKDKKENLNIWKSLWGKYGKIYDVKIFELLPLHLKIKIIENYQVLFGDKLEISEYFYQYRRIWKDMRKRIEENQFINMHEKLKNLEHRQILFL